MKEAIPAVILERPIRPSFPSPRLNQIVRDMAAFYVYSGCRPEVDRSGGGFRTRIVGPEGPINEAGFARWVDDTNFWEGIGPENEYPVEIWRDAVAQQMALILAGR